MKLGIVMDPIKRIKTEKDSSFAMLLAAQKRDLEILYMEPQDLFLKENRACANIKMLSVEDNPDSWFQFTAEDTIELASLDIILMRQDPPVDMEYFVATYILEQAKNAGVLVVNDPASLRDVNEKVYCTWFADLMSPSLVSKDVDQIRLFLEEHTDLILKPLHSMGGDSIFRVRKDETNLNVILETLTQNGQQFIMAQRYIPEITHGDKRILLIDGKAVPYALARIPRDGETRGNLAAGGRAKAMPISPEEQTICEAVGPTLKDKGLLFVGLDIIGNYLTEINVTSPTCIRELDRAYDLDIAGDFIDCVLSQLK